MSYASCYFGRRSFSSLATSAIDSGVTVEQIGMIGSSMALGYSSGKLWATLAIDGLSPVVVYPIIIISIGIINFLFAYTTTVSIMIFCWFINGALHGIAWVCSQIHRNNILNTFKDAVCPVTYRMVRTIRARHVVGSGVY